MIKLNIEIVEKYKMIKIIKLIYLKIISKKFDKYIKDKNKKI